MRSVMRMASGRQRLPAEDPRLRNAARELGYQAIQRAEHLLEYGSPTTQVQLIRSLVSPLLAGTKDKDEDDERIAKVRSELAELMGSVRESLGAPLPPARDTDETRDDRKARP